MTPVRLVGAEFRRLAGTRLWLAALLAATGSGAFVAIMALAGPESFHPPLPGLYTAAGTRTILGMLGLTMIVPALLGTTAVTSEYRHGTITTTFLLVPRRAAMLSAKLVAYALGGTAYGLLASASAALGLYAATAVHGTTPGLPAATVAALLGRAALTMGAYAMLGAAVGSLLRHQVAALAVVGGYLYAGETALLLIPGVATAYPYLPGGATAALGGFTYLSDALTAQHGTHGITLLPPPLGAAVLLAYAATAATIAVLVPLRRDIT